ncbi:MAG: NADPH-dependent FMN reductase [Nanobdellota archaeon]
MAKISIIYGSVREERQGIKAARFIRNEVKERGHEATLIDPKEYDIPFLDRMYKEFEKAPEDIEKIGKILDESDGFMIVSGEYNHSIPPALKNLLDHFQKEYMFKPSAIASYSAGSFGGVRAAVHLRALLAELGCPTISSIFPMSEVQDSFDEKGNAIETAYEKRIEKFLDEFDWYVEALKEQRKKGTPF